MGINAEFEDKKGFKISLTDDKVYVTAVGSQETFALRSVNGIGTYDDIEDYNRQIEEYKKKDFRFLIGVGIIFFFFGVYSLVEISVSIVCFILSFICFAVGAKAKSPKDQAKMKSYFRLMLSGGDRKFQFDKKASNAKDVADFCNKVEDTLTAYNK